MSPKRDAFTVTKVALPTCGGCDQCGDFNEKHLYLLAHDSKYYCKVCFLKMAIRWPRRIERPEGRRPGMQADGTEFVVLTDAEVSERTEIGRARHLQNIKQKRKGAHAVPNDRANFDYGLQIDIDGAIAEQAVANAMGTVAVGLLPTPDDGRDVGALGVRSTKLAHGKLILHPGDDDDRRFLLVISHSPYQHTIVGGLIAKQGKQAKYWETQWRSPAFFVPQDAPEMRRWVEIRDRAIALAQGGDSVQGRVQEVPGDDRVQGGGD